MSNPPNLPGDPYHPGPAWGDRVNPQDTGYGQQTGYGYPPAGQQSHYDAAAQPAYPSQQYPSQNQSPQYASPLYPAQQYPSTPYQGQQDQPYPPNVTGPWAADAQRPPAKSGRPRALTAAAALSLLTGSTVGVAGGVLLTAAAAAGASRSALGTFGSSNLPARQVALAAVIAVILLATAFVLLWGAIDAALARGTSLAIAGNIVTAVLALIVIVQTSAWLLIWLVLPAIAVVLLVQTPVRNYLASRPRTD